MAKKWEQRHAETIRVLKNMFERGKTTCQEGEFMNCHVGDKNHDMAIE